MHDLLTDTPTAYARRLCYISDASTIYARTMTEFGRSPSMEWIKREQAERSKAGRTRNVGEAIGPDPVKPVKPPEPSIPVVFTPSDIIRYVAARYGTTVEAIKGKGQAHKATKPRFLICAILQARGNSLTQIGRWLGDRDHTTIGNACKRFHSDPGDMMATYSIFVPAAIARPG